MTADFLHELFDPYQGERYVETRLIKDGEVIQYFYQWPRESDYLSTGAVASSGEGWDVYFGVLPRNQMSGKASDCPFMVRTLWADLDAKTVGSKDVAIRSAVDFPLRPNIIVDSGHGSHLYWLLRDDTEYTTARDVMKGLARELHGDNVSDAPRVLRVPGTTNWKVPEKPEPVRLIYFDVTHKYRWWDFSDLISRPAPLPILPLREGGEAPADLPHWLADLIVSGAPKGTRSEECFKVVLWLMRYGYNAEQIKDVFDKNPDGIGQKYHEKKGHGPSWLNYTINAARRAIS